MEDSTKMTLKITGAILVMIVVITGVNFGLSKLRDAGYKASGYQTETDIELTVVDKDRHTSYIYTGRAMIPQSSYSITVDLGDGTPYKFKCSLSQYQSVEIGNTALFTVIKTKNNELVEIRLE